jgi:hypothetical protein
MSVDLNGNPQPEFRNRTIQINGDYESVSYDTSLFRWGSGWQISSNSNLYSLASSQLVMEYRTHNIPFGSNGNYTVRDDQGGCTLWLYGEDEVERWYAAPSGNKGTPPVWTQYMTYASLTGTLTPTNIGGRTSGTAAPAGSIGERITATAAPAAVSLTTATSATVTSISLTAGVWLITGAVNYTPAATTSISQWAQGANSVAATLGAQDTYSKVVLAAEVPTAVVFTEPIVPLTINISASQTEYLVAQATFTLSTLTAGGTIVATRIG